jgi:hypothetical protein
MATAVYQHNTPYFWWGSPWGVASCLALAEGSMMMMMMIGWTISSPFILGGGPFPALHHSTFGTGIPVSNVIIII